MSRLDSNSFTSNHGLDFSIAGAKITVDEMAEFVTQLIMFDSEKMQEQFAHEATHAILNGVKRKVQMVQKAQSRAAWVSRHPPNHAGYYYCHLCGGWVHEREAELDEIEPRSYRRGEDPLRDDNRRMAHAWPQHDANGKQYCMGNRGKGSKLVKSATLEIAPPEGEF